MNNLTLQQAQQLDEILSFYIEHRKSVEKSNTGYDFNLNDIIIKFQITEELASLLLNEIIETQFQNLHIVSYFTQRDGFVQYYWFRTNENTCKFIDAGGFEKMFYDQKKSSTKEELKRELEIENLKIALRQHRFNKISVMVNAALTIVTIILSILIAKGIIGDK